MQGGGGGQRLLYFTLLYSTLLYFTLLYSTLLYFTLLYFTLLYGLYSTLLRGHGTHELTWFRNDWSSGLITRILLELLEYTRTLLGLLGTTRGSLVIC